MMKSVHRWTRFLVVLIIIGAIASLSSMVAAREGARSISPEAIKGNVVDDYHGMKIPDPYRWLEDPDSPETRAWIEAQNRLTFDYLEQIPERQKIQERLTALWDYEKYGLPYRYGNRYFFTKNDGLQNQSVLYTVTSLDDDPAMLLDPNGFSEDGTVALSGWSPTDDGRLMAYGLSTAGSDWEEWFVRDVDTGQHMTVTLVFPSCANQRKGKISVLTPLGSMLLGARLGQTFTCPISGTLATVIVERILYQPEAAGGYYG